jgi:hypothetical protein
MTTWKLLYENRFPRNATTGASIRDHYRAAQGVQTIQSGPVFLMFSGLPGLGIGDGRNLTFRPDATLQDVVGVDVSMELAFATLFQGHPLTLFSMDSTGLSATLTMTQPLLWTGRVLCRLSVQLDGVATVVENLRFRPRLGPQPPERRRLQVRWYSNGQLHVWLDGLLVAYENAFKPGHRFHLSRFSIGDVAQPMNGVINAAVTEFRLLEIREESAVDALGVQLDPEYVPRPSERCAKVAVALHDHLMREARKLMAAFSQSQTTPWRKEDGGTPFSADALAAHQSGTRAGLAFARYLRDGSQESGDEVLTHLKSLLTLLAAEQPAALKDLVEKAKQARKELEADCYDAVKELRSSNPALFARLDPLNSKLDALTQSLAGGV